MTDLTTAQKEAYARAHSARSELWALEFRHSTFGGIIRLVNFGQDVTLPIETGAPEDAGTNQLFTGTLFRFTPPDQGTEPEASLTAQIDGVSGALQPYLVAANETAEPIECTVRAYLYDVSTLTVIEPMTVLHLQVRNISLTNVSVAVALGYRNASNQEFPRVRYTPTSNPTLTQ
jgi:hypothetical protein